MRPITLLLLSFGCSVALPTVALAQLRSSKSKKDSDWQSHVSESFQYKTTFPGKPKEVTKKPSTRAGELVVGTASYEGKDAVYAVTATQYPEKIKGADPKLLLLAAKDALSANGGKIVSDDTVSMTGPDDAKLDGWEIIVEFGSTRIRTRLVLVGQTLYQVSVTGKKDPVANDTAGKFLAAFEVTK